MKFVSTKEAAEKLSVTPVRVRQLIREGKLKATLVGRDYVIDEADLSKIKIYGKAGRPSKGD